MTKQTYGQYCGLARAVEIVGEPWAMLIIRDLFVEAKAFSELRSGLPQMAGDLMASRLESLEQAHVIRRRPAAGKTESSVFELTEYGNELEDIIVRLARWGLRTIGGFRPDEVVTPDILITALRVTFRPDVARGIRVNFVIELADIVVHACVDDGHVEVGKGHLLDAHLIIESGPPLKLLITGEMSPREALETGGVRLRAPDGGPGNPDLLSWFVELFHIPPPPITRAVADGLTPARRPAPQELLSVNEHAVPVGTTS